MKKILITALVLASFASTQAAPGAKEARPADQQPADTKTKEATPAPAPSKEDTAAATDDSANYVGTNDFYLALIREGIRKA